MPAALSIVFNVALPVFAIILSGYLAGRARILGDSASDALNRFVYFFAMPPVVFLGVARRPLEDLLNWPFIGAFLGGMLAIYVLAWALGWIIHRERAEILSLQALNASFSNTGYMGIPLFLAAFGPDGLAPAILATIIMSAVMVGIAVVALELCRSAGLGPMRALRDVGRALLRNPLVMAAVLGLPVSMAGIAMPVPVVSFGTLLGAAAGPCALFAMGLFLSGQRLHTNLGEVGWIVFLKLVPQPLLTWYLAFVVLPVDPAWAGAAVILAALPTGALTFVVAQQYSTYVERTSAVILVSTVMSVVTLSVVMALHGPAPA